MFLRIRTLRFRRQPRVLPTIEVWGESYVTKIHWVIVTGKSFTLYPFNMIHVSDRQC